MRERILPGAFDDDLANNTDVCLLYNHDTSDILGRVSNDTVTLSQDNHGLRFKGSVPETNLGNDVLVLVDNRTLQGCSFSAITIPSATTENRYVLNNVTYVERSYSKLRLDEISICARPVYLGTDVYVDNDKIQRVLNNKAKLKSLKERFRK